MRAAAIDSIFIPGPRVHEWLDEEAEGGLLVELEIMKKPAERLAFAAALREVVERIADFVPQEILHLAEIDEITDRAQSCRGTKEIPDGRAIRVTARQGSEVFEL